MMDWIDEWVSVGSIADSENVEELRNQRVDVVLDARVCFHFHVDKLSEVPDVDKVLRAADVLVELSNMKIRVLVHCFWGKDRTPFVAMIYTYKKYGKSYEEAYKFVKERHPEMIFHWDWIKLLPDSS